MHRIHSTSTFVAFGFFLLAVASVAAQKPASVVPAKAVEQSQKASVLFTLAMAKPEERIPKALLENVVAVAVITDMKTAGLLIEGVGMGRGVVARRFANGKWGAPAYIRMAAMSIGPKLGANNFNIILLFMNERSANWLLDNKAVNFDRQKAPAAGPIGEIRTEQNEVVPVADVFSYVVDDGRLQSKDLKNLLKNFAISFDNDLNKSTYGAKAADVLSDSYGTRVQRTPEEVLVFSKTVEKFCQRDQNGSDPSTKP